MARASRFRKRTPEEIRQENADTGDVRLMIRVALGPEGSLGPGKLRLMELIDEKGSISAACKEMGMSYRRAWRLLRSLNAAFREEVVATRQGGNQGGGAQLTPFGRTLLERCEVIREKARQAVRGDLAALEKDYVHWAPAPGTEQDKA
jgi:molybdate transport system regulatory protein